jgi:hypothetical protein
VFALSPAIEELVIYLQLHVKHVNVFGALAVVLEQQQHNNTTTTAPTAQQQQHNNNN